MDIMEEATMANDTGTVEAVKGAGKREYKHPDFPDRSLSLLEKDAAGFDIDNHLVALLFKEPFYADIIRSLHKEKTQAIPTAGVLFKDDIMRFWWNPLFMAAYNPAVVGGILKHEALHLALEHTTTRRYQPHQIWNIACDLAINSTLSEDEMPPCGFRPGKKFGTPHDWSEWKPEQQARHLKLSALVESLPLHLTSEEYFGRLMESDVVKEMLEEGEKGKGMPGEGDPGESGFPQGQDDHSGWDELSDEEREYVAGKVRQAVKEAQERADSKNAWGSVPVGMREEIRKKVRGEIDWKAVLRHFVGTTSRADRLSSVYRMNRKYAGIHPGHARDYRPTLNCYIDQSGSMSDEDIILCFGELANLSHRVDIVVYHFDTEVDEDSKTTWKKGMANPKALRTRCGGTDFDAPTRHAAKSKPEGYIILTDGGAPKPDHSRIRRCWVLVPGQELAFGDADAKDVVVKMKRQIKGIDS